MIFFHGIEIVLPWG